MPNIESAVKRMRQNEQRRQLNRGVRSKMRTEIKKFRSLVQDGKVEDAKALLPSVYSVIDQTARKGKIHANTASRYKSRLTKLLA